MKHISSTIILMSLALWACSCEDSDTKLPLKAEFESDKTSVLVGDEVSFNDLSTVNLLAGTGLSRVPRLTLPS